MLSKDDRFAGCRIISCCGHGAYGAVYVAEDAIGRKVALKILDSQNAGEKEQHGIQNYMRIPLKPESMVNIFHAGVENGLFYYIMELADNASEDPNEYVPDTLAERLRKTRRMPLEQNLELCGGILDALASLHGAGLLHRDIKPENILFFNGKPKLGDPGLADDYSHTLSVAGTLGYIPPELLHSPSKQNPSCDIYALGKVMYCTMTGNAPEEFPSMPQDMETETLVKICKPLARLCNAVPEKRCQSVDEFRRIIVDIQGRHSRMWWFWRRFMADRRWRHIVLSVIAAIIVIVTLFSIAIHSNITRQNQRIENALENLETLRSRQEALSLQLNEIGENFPLSERMQYIDSLLADSNNRFPWLKRKKAADAVTQLSNELRRLADANCPKIINDDAAVAERQHSVASAFSYLSSPLGKWFLDEERRNDLKRNALDAASRLAVTTSYPIKNVLPSIMIGSNYSLPQLGFRCHFKFVPSGAFHSTTTGKTEHINHHFWMLETELSFMQFLSITHINASNQDNMPASKIGWNDMLALCISMNQYVKKITDMPPGYGFRPPTEAEWEYAAQCGMLSERPAPRPQSSGKPVSVGGSSPANSFGFQNMDDNLSEAVIPYPAFQPPKGWTICRGANFRDKKTGIAPRTLMRLDQVTMETFGFRPVLAPVDDDFYSSAWLVSMPFNSAEVDGKFYTGTTSCCAATSWEEARRIAETLGGRLPEPATHASLASIFRLLEADDRFATPLGITFRNGAWRTLSDDAPSPFASSLPPPANDSERTALSALTRHNGIILPTSPKNHLPSIIIEYQSKKSFDSRPAPQFSQIIELGGRRFGVLRSMMSCTVHEGFLSLFGMKAPVIHDSELLKQLVERLGELDYAVAIGCHRHLDGWRWSDGSEFEPNEELENVENSTRLMSKNYRSLVAHNRKLKMDVKSEAILVELTEK